MTDNIYIYQRVTICLQSHYRGLEAVLPTDFENLLTLQFLVYRFRLTINTYTQSIQTGCRYATAQNSVAVLTHRGFKMLV